MLTYIGPPWHFTKYYVTNCCYCTCRWYRTLCKVRKRENSWTLLWFNQTKQSRHFISTYDENITSRKWLHIHPPHYKMRAKVTWIASTTSDKQQFELVTFSQSHQQMGLTITDNLWYRASISTLLTTTRFERTAGQGITSNPVAGAT